MKTRKISGQSYYVYPNGVMVPEILVRETGSKIRTPSDAMPQLHDIANADVEHVVVFTLDGNKQIIKRHIVGQGLANSCSMHPRETFRPAFLDGACSILVAHNHPSGNLEPSESDLMATRRMCEVAKTMGIPVLDHMIVTRNGFISLREKYPNYFF